MRRRVVVVQYKPLEFLPPVMNLLLYLKSLGRNPIFIGVESNASNDFLLANGIEHYYIPYDPRLYKNPTILSKITHRLIRASRFYRCRSVLRSILQDIRNGQGDFLLWFAEVQSAALLGNAWKKYQRRAITIYELADFKGKDWWGFSFGKFIKSTVVVEPEINRARTIKDYFELSNMPLVVANKPAGHPRIFCGELPDGVNRLLKKANGRSIFMYQGVWTSDRRDVGFVLEAIAKNRPRYCVAVMPGTDEIEKLSSKYDNVFAVDYIPPPRHLAATSVASVGIAIYNPSGRTELERKNALFCAPNKIYEYAGFGVPTLGNKIPGLEDTIGRFGAGKCVNIDEEEIVAAADDLVANHDKYVERANQFFDHTNVEQQVCEVLNAMEGV